MVITPCEGPNQSKTSCLVFIWDWSHRLAFPPILLKISDDHTSTEVCQVGGKRWDSSLWTYGIVDLRREVSNGHAVLVRNVIIHSGARRWSWVPGSTIRRVVHDDDLEHPTHEQKARHTTTIDFEFPQSLKNSTTMFQVAVRQPTTTDLIDSLTQPLIETSSMTTRLSGLALTEIRAMKPEE
jgi:hypothetical protein